MSNGFDSDSKGTPGSTFILVIMLLLSAGWYMNETKATLDIHENDLNVNKGQVISDKITLVSDYEDAKILLLEISSNDERIQFSANENGPWDNKLSLEQELGPEGPTTVNYYILADSSIPHGTYKVRLEVDKGWLSRGIVAGFKIIVNN